MGSNGKRVCSRGGDDGSGEGIDAPSKATARHAGVGECRVRGCVGARHVRGFGRGDVSRYRSVATGDIDGDGHDGSSFLTLRGISISSFQR